MSEVSQEAVEAVILPMVREHLNQWFNSDCVLKQVFPIEEVKDEGIKLDAEYVNGEEKGKVFIDQRS